MEKITETLIVEYKYESEEERSNHVGEMEKCGWECTGQLRRSDNSLMDKDREYYWYAKFICIDREDEDLK